MATPPKPPLRPKRFALELPLEFRRYDSDRWWAGRSEDISANGLLFRSRNPVPPLTPLDVKLELPSSLAGDATVRLLCSGYVVRTMAPETPSDEARIAATFFDFHLSNGKGGPMSELRQAQRLAMQSEVARLFHRLNTLLFLIQGNAELVSLEPGNELKVRELTTRVLHAAEDASATVRTLAEALK
ncbi:MAG: PilZ domain-containing protein [Terriglobales bacterium]